MSTTRRILLAWIDQLTNRDLLELRFGSNANWCESMRGALRKMAQGPA